MGIMPQMPFAIRAALITAATVLTLHAQPGSGAGTGGRAAAEAAGTPLRKSPSSCRTSTWSPAPERIPWSGSPTRACWWSTPRTAARKPMTRS